MPYFYAGDTVTIGAGDLALNNVPVTTGAVVTIQLFNPDGTQAGSDYVGSVTGDDWTVDLSLPATPLGKYSVKITASKSGAVWHGKVDDLWVKGF